MTREDVIKRLDSDDKDFYGENLSGLDLRCLNFTDVNMQGSDLSGTNLRGSVLTISDLRGTDFRGANLRNADLRGAIMDGAIMDDETDIDYACWPLWCGGLHVKIAKRQACQLAYHFCNQDCGDPEYIEARNAILNFANQFHLVDECGVLEPR